MSASPGETPRPGPAPLRAASNHFGSLAGIDRLRTFTSGTSPLPPAYLTVGMGPVGVEEAEVRYQLEASPWLTGSDGELDPAAIAYFLDAPVTNAMHVLLPPGRTLRTVQLTVEYCAEARLTTEVFQARSRMLSIEERAGFGQVELRGADPYPLAYGSCRVVMIDFPPTAEKPSSQVPVPSILPYQFPTPPPPTRGDRSGLEFLDAIVARTEAVAPFWGLLGCYPSEVEFGRVVMTMKADPWLASPAILLYGGALASLGQAALVAAMLSADEAGSQTRVLNFSFNFTRSVPPDDSLLVAEAHLVHRGRTLAIGDVDVRDAHGRRVGFGRATGLVGRVPE